MLFENYCFLAARFFPSVSGKTYIGTPKTKAIKSTTVETAIFTRSKSEQDFERSCVRDPQPFSESVAMTEIAARYDIVVVDPTCP